MEINHNGVRIRIIIEIIKSTWEGIQFAVAYDKCSGVTDKYQKVFLGDGWNWCSFRL